MIRKPTDKDFQEGAAVRALRETQTIAVEGSKGIGAGLHRLMLMWFGGVMAFGFVVSAIPYLGFAIIPIAGAAFWFWRDRRRAAAQRVEAVKHSVQMESLARQGHHTSRRPPELAWDEDDAAFPDDVRREAKIEVDIGAVVQQAVVFFMLGFLLMFMLGAVFDTTAIVGGIVLVALAVLIASRAFGDRTVLAWDKRKVKVHHLLSEGEMQWSDVVDVTFEKRSRLNFKVYFQTGSSRNIVLHAPINRLGGPNEMRVPIRFLGMDKDEQVALLRDLLCWRAMGNSVASGPAHKVAAVSVPQTAYRPAPSDDPRESFDPDAIMQNYMREREETIRIADRADDYTQAGVPSPQAMNPRPVFGRKRA